MDSKNAKTKFKHTVMINPPSKLTFSDNSTSMANNQSIYHDKPDDLPLSHWAPNIKIENFDIEYKPHNQEWRTPNYQISSDDTEDERVTYMRQAPSALETEETQRLKEMCNKNRGLIWSSDSAEKRNDRLHEGSNEPSPESITVNQNYSYATHTARKQHRDYNAPELPQNYAPKEQRYTN